MRIISSHDMEERSRKKTLVTTHSKAPRPGEPELECLAAVRSSPDMERQLARPHPHPPGGRSRRRRTSDGRSLNRSDGDR